MIKRNVHKCNIAICHKCKKLREGSWTLDNKFTCKECRSQCKDIVTEETIKKVSVRRDNA